VPPSVRLGAFALLFGGAWVVLLVRLLWAKGLPRWPAFALLALAMLPAASLSASAYHEQTVAEGVILAEEVVGRKGPDERGYAPSFSEPLTEGVEFTVVERRAGWLYVRLPDERTTWIPEDAAAVI